MVIKPINTDADYKGSTKEVENLMTAAADTKDGEKPDAMVTLIQAYDVGCFPLYSWPVEAIKFEVERKAHCKKSRAYDW